MGCSDKGETPPPLPVKGSNADYGNLLDNQDLTSPSTPPPPPPHQRVGVLIRAERSFLMMHATCNETRGRYTHLTSGSASSTIPYPCTSCANVCPSMHVSHLCVIFLCHQRSVGISQLAARAHARLSTPLLFILVPPPPAGPVLRRD